MAENTRASLLLRIRDPRDESAWQQFAEVYGPLIYHFVRKQGLQDADADDLTQTVLLEVSASIRRLDYDRGRGSFRGWLFAVVRNQLAKFRRREGQCPAGSGDTAVQAVLEAQPDRQADQEVAWERECERYLFLAAVNRVRRHFEESSWQAFWMTAVDGKSAAEAATALGLRVGAVYTAKSRVLDRVKKEIEQLREDESS
jgi:RNA polymerase sigma-70 factor (ECF subfamily)